MQSLNKNKFRIVKMTQYEYNKKIISKDDFIHLNEEEKKKISKKEHLTKIAKIGENYLTQNLTTKKKNKNTYKRKNFYF